MPKEAPTILIIESDQATRDLYQRELGRSYRVLAADDKQNALSLLDAETITAVVLEPALPGESGWNLLAAIRWSHTDPAIPVILCTALDERRRGMQFGADAYLVKPVTPATLLATLNHVLRSAPGPVSPPNPA